MNWFVTILIVRCRVEGESPDNPLFDRQIRVLKASDAEVAFQKAMKLGEAENHSYNNGRGDNVAWEFVGLGDLCQLQEEQISDGTEVYSRLDHGNPETEVIRSKEKLTAFWTASNMQKTAHKLLGESTRRFAPR
jgi:hypothetical protein